MALEFKLPELGENIESADVTRVLIKIGEKVEQNQPVVEIETGKATVEVPSEVSGIVDSVKIRVGDKIKIGATLFTYSTAGTALKKAETPKFQKPEISQPAVKKETEPVITTKTQAPGKVEFRLPFLGEGIESGDVTKVLVKPGDNVEFNQSVIELETGKASVEVPSEVSGKVLEVKVQSGAKAAVGDVILIVMGSSSTPVKEVSKPAPALRVESQTKQASETQEERSKMFVPPVLSVTKAGMPDKIAPAAPSVRKFAREIGIDINEVSGSGPSGRISIDDVKLFAKNLNQKIRKEGGLTGGIGIVKETLPDFSKWGDTERTEMTNVRRKTAEHLSYAWSTIPHVTQFDKADITDLEELRKKYSKTVEQAGGKLTVTAILLKVIASALKKFPQFNSSVDMERKEVVYKKYYNIGVAVDTEKGLLVPVIKNVDKKNITELSADLAEISRKARDKKLTIDDMQGGNFSISNLGGIGGTYFTPIVNSPEVAILGVSRGAMEPKFVNGGFVPGLMLPLSLSYDHRIIDGADAARFIRWVAEALENPFLLNLEG